MNRYDIVGQIGKGTYSTVYKAIDKSKMTSKDISISPTYVAIKVSHEDSIDLDDYNKEVNVLRTLNHPNILRFIDNFKIESRKNDAEQVKTQFSSPIPTSRQIPDNSYCIVSEFIDGVDLLSYLNTNGPFQETNAKKIMAEILSAVLYLHSKNIMHRDLKLENIMITKEFHVKIIDFGFSCQSSNQDTMRTTLCGSIAYCSPEILLNIPYNFGCDIWSLGIVFYAIVVQQLPFWDDNVSMLAKKILELNTTYPLFVSKDCQNFINSMLEKDQNIRPNIFNIVKHPFIAFEFSSYQTLLVKRKEPMNDNNTLPFPDPVFLSSLQTRDPNSITFLNLSPTSNEDEDPNELIPQRRIKNPSRTGNAPNNIMKRFSMINIFTPQNRNLKTPSPGLDYISSRRKRRRTHAQVQVIQQKQDQTIKSQNLSESHTIEPLQPLYKKNTIFTPQASAGNRSPF